VAAVLREEVRDRPGGAAEIEDAVVGSRLGELGDGLQPKLGPRRPLAVRRGHVVHELLVVLGRRAPQREAAHLVDQG
jgi:hypothetical protein